jgi:hypothetical protein
MAKEVVTRTGKYWIDEQLGILRWVYHPGTERSTLADAKENFAAISALVENKRYPFLCDIKNCLDIDRDATSYYAGPEFAQNLLAMALIGGSPLSTVMGTVYLAANPGCVPSVLFASQAEAIEWLKTFA